MQPMFSGFTLMFSLIVSIGAQNVFVLRQGLLKQHVVLVVAICWLCDVLLSASGVFGLGALLAQNAVAAMALSLAGGAFLLYYAALSARRAWLGGGQLQVSAAGANQIAAPKVAAATLGVTLLNPHVYIDTMMFVGGATMKLAQAEKLYFLVGISMASALWFAAIGFGAHFLQPLFRRERVWQILDSLIALMMLNLSLGLFRQAFAG